MDDQAIKVIVIGLVFGLVVLVFLGLLFYLVREQNLSAHYARLATIEGTLAVPM